MYVKNTYSTYISVINVFLKLAPNWNFLAPLARFRLIQSTVPWRWFEGLCWWKWKPQSAADRPRRWGTTSTAVAIKVTGNCARCALVARSLRRLERVCFARPIECRAPRTCCVCHRRPDMSSAAIRGVVVRPRWPSSFHRHATLI